MKKNRVHNVDTTLVFGDSEGPHYLSGSVRYGLLSIVHLLFFFWFYAISCCLKNNYFFVSGNSTPCIRHSISCASILFADTCNFFSKVKRFGQRNITTGTITTLSTSSQNRAPLQHLTCKIYTNPPP